MIASDQKRLVVDAFARYRIKDALHFYQSVGSIQAANIQLTTLLNASLRYLGQQQKAIERLKKAEQRTIPDWFNYGSVSGLSREMKERLQRVRPRTIGQAGRIPGVTPAAVSLINVYIEIQARRAQQASTLSSD